MKASISDAIYTYDVLQKRKVFLDQIMEGLEDFHLATTMRLFPAVFESLFVDANQWKPQEVIDILQPTKVEMTDAEQMVYNFLKRFITECNPKGMCLSHAM